MAEAVNSRSLELNEGSASDLSLSSCLQIAVARASDRGDWEAFVSAFEHATFYHRWAWGDIVQSVYGYEPIRLTARRGGELCGVLAMSDVRSLFFGRSLVSTAFTVGGGVAAQDDEAAIALAARARAIGVGSSVRYVELRGEKRHLEGWTERADTHVSFSRSIVVDEQARLKAVPRKRRADLRKALAAAEGGKLSVEFGRDLDAFYRLYAIAMRTHGSPVFPKRFAHALLEAFGDDIEIAIARYEGAAVGAVMSFYWRGIAMPYYVGSVKAARSLHVIDYLTWRLMGRAVERGAHTYDFGRSKVGSTHFKYKKSWGFSPEPVTSQFALVTADAPPNLNPSNPKFKRITEIWSRLPLPVTNIVGPILARNFV